MKGEPLFPEALINEHHDSIVDVIDIPMDLRRALITATIEQIKIVPVDWITVADFFK
jgi:hypothetical protein